MEKEQKDVVLLDAYNLIYRAFHGNKAELTNENGLPTGAIYTTLKMLKKIPQQFSNLEYVLAVFDGGGNNFRKDLDVNYKANRSEMPEDLKKQFPYIKQAMKILGWPIFQAKDVEADDVLSTLAVRAAHNGFHAYIISGDKDFRQIVSNNISVIDTMQDIEYTPEAVFEKMGLPPSQIRDYLALVGDSSDNVPGVEKLGPKTAIKLLSEYETLEKIIENKDKITGKVGDNLRKVIDSQELLLWQKLVTVKTDVELNFKRSEMRFSEVDQNAWQDFCIEMNFKSFLNNSPKP